MTMLQSQSTRTRGGARAIELTVAAATTDNVTCFGALLARPARPGNAAAEASEFYRGDVHISRPVRFTCEHPVELSVATLARRAGEVRYLERHFAHTQTFIPLGGKPFVMVLAPPSAADMPDLDAARALYFDGTQGFTLHVGTWHEFPFAVLANTDIVVVMSSQTGYDLIAKDPQTQEALGPDLDKKDIVRRTGVVLTVDLDAAPEIS